MSKIKQTPGFISLSYCNDNISKVSANKKLPVSCTCMFFNISMKKYYIYSFHKNQEVIRLMEEGAIGDLRNLFLLGADPRHLDLETIADTLLGNDSIFCRFGQFICLSVFTTCIFQL